MYQYASHVDTIAAIATASGAGGVGIVRLSGSQSAAILGKVFAARTSAAPETWTPNMLHIGWVRDSSGARLDEALAVVMRAPRSYTAEDSAEIHTHGGLSASRVTLDLCLHSGARLAQPGEFTRRAFLNGRIDLAQAEAVLDMVSARTELMLRAAGHQLSGELSARLMVARETLLGIYSDIEALLNFPEDDTDHGQCPAAHAGVTSVLGRLKALLATADAGMMIRNGIRMAICGKPNAGKSSLLNALLRHARAIVTDIAGTTRDTLEESANIKGIPVNLVDTAGILQPRDKVEEEAVRRSYEAMASADIVVLVLDRSRPLEAVDRDLLAQTIPARTVVVLNKCDLPAQISAGEAAAAAGCRQVVAVSTLERDGIAALEDVLAGLAVHGGPSALAALADSSAVVLTNARHVQALRLAVDALQGSLQALDTGAPLELVSDGIKTAINHLDAVTGRDIDSDALDRIFAGFCIGK